MTELISEIPEEGLPTIIQTFQNHGTIQNLLHDMSFYLKVLFYIIIQYIIKTILFNKNISRSFSELHPSSVQLALVYL